MVVSCETMAKFEEIVTGVSFEIESRIEIFTD